MPYIIPGGCPCSGGGDGALISAAKLTDQGHLIFTYEDGTVVDTGELLNQTQVDHLNNGISGLDLGDGLLIGEDGKLKANVSIKMGDQIIPLEDGALNIPAASEDNAGFVKLSDDFEVNEEGQIQLNAVSVQKLVVEDGDELIIGG